VSRDKRILIYRSCNTFPPRYRRWDFLVYFPSRNATGAKAGGCDGANLGINGRRRHRMVARMVFFTVIISAPSGSANKSADKRQSPSYATLTQSTV
jgi:hypothetical protein